jgi:hypothetical protein
VIVTAIAVVLAVDVATVAAQPCPGPPICGNGIREGSATDEECDYGSFNGTAGIHCSINCKCLTPISPTQLTDADGDKAEDGCDNCPGVYNPDQRNTDCAPGGTLPGCNDGGDVCDPCPARADNSDCDWALSGGINAGPTTQTVLSLPLPAPPGVNCGNGVLNPGEECDTTSAAKCPGRCTASCTCVTRPPKATITVTVPPFALCTDTSISVTNHVAPNGVFFSMDALKYALRPEGERFLQPATVNLTWDDVDNDGRVNDGVCFGTTTTTCDGPADCGGNPCVGGAGPAVLESKLELTRNSATFSKEGFNQGCNGVNAPLCRCPAHDPFAISSSCAAGANCNDPTPGVGCRTVALASRGCLPPPNPALCGNGSIDPNEECDGTNATACPGMCQSNCTCGSNTWTFETCDFSNMLLGDPVAELIPGGGTPATDCVMEWSVVNPFNAPERDKKGFPNKSQTCTDGDPLCDTDGSENGTCTFRVGLCFNNDDQRLVKAGTPVCTAADVATWELKKPLPTSANPDESVNALALRSAIAALGASSLSGVNQQLLTFTPALAAAPACSPLVSVTVPIHGRKGRASLGARATTTVASGARRGVRDNDRLKLICVAP